MNSADDERSNASPAVFKAAVALDVLIVLAVGWVLWVTVEAEAAKVAAATNNGLPGIMVIEGVRPSRGSDIPVGTFTEPDGTRTPDVAWQDRPAAVGERKDGVRVGDRAWAPQVRLGIWDLLVTATVTVLFVWRLLHLVGLWRGRHRTGP